MHDGATHSTETEAVVLVYCPFDLRTLAGTRRTLHQAILEAGVPTGRAHTFTFAINEGLINAITHGGGHGEVTLTQANERLIAAVQDFTPTQPMSFPDAPPLPSAERGRGLWLIAQSCDAARFEARSGGLRLVLELVLNPAA